MFVNSDVEHFAGYSPAFVRAVHKKRRLERAVLASRRSATGAAGSVTEKLKAAKALLHEIQDITEELEGKQRARADIDARLKELAERAAATRPQGGFVHSYAAIEKRICLAMGVSRGELRGNRRFKQVTLARQAVAYWACRLTNRSLPEIGRLMGGKDHTTVLHSKRTYPEKRARMGRYVRPVR